MDNLFIDVLTNLFKSSGFAALDWRNILMIIISFVLVYLAIAKQFEPLLLLPIAFGMFLSNLPLAGLMAEAAEELYTAVLRVTSSLVLYSWA